MTEPVADLSEANGLLAETEGLASGLTCAGCGQPLVFDQRYCLACGRPASPVRLAFLDVLRGEYQATGEGGAPALAGAYLRAGHPPPAEPDGLLGALRRYSGLLALIGVLLACLLIGLLVGHWITAGPSGGSGAGRQIIEVKGLGGSAPAADGGGGSGSSASAGSGAAPTSTGSTAAGHSSTKSRKAAEAREEATAAKEAQTATALPPVKRKTSASTLQKLGNSTGKQHEREVSKLISGDEPIETH